MAPAARARARLAADGPAAITARPATTTSATRSSRLTTVGPARRSRSGVTRGRQRVERRAADGGSRCVALEAGASYRRAARGRGRRSPCRCKFCCTGRKTPAHSHLLGSPPGRERTSPLVGAPVSACLPVMPARRIVCLCLLSASAVPLAGGGSSSADLLGKYHSGQQQASQLKSRISAETQRIQSSRGRSPPCRPVGRGAAQRLDPDPAAAERHRPARRCPRPGCVTLRADLPAIASPLAAELRQRYEAPPPTLVNVVVDSGGFNELINGIRDLTRWNGQRAGTTAAASARVAVAAQTVRLAKVQARRRRATAAVLVERDNIAAAQSVDRRPRALGPARQGPRHLQPQQPAQDARPRGAGAGRARPLAPRRCPRAERVVAARRAASTRRSSPTAASTASSRRPGPTTRSTRSR